MITSLQGTLTVATPLQAVIEAGGLGYEVNIPVTTAERLPGIGAQAKLHTFVVYREDAQTLYGFATAAERDFFRLMVEKVSGVGPKVALTVMSKLSLPILQATLQAGDVETLTQCPGIGRKTAERLVMELRDKLGASGTAGGTLAAASSRVAPASGEDKIADAVSALTALGYKPADADKAIRRSLAAIGPGATTEQLIKKALS